MWSFAPEGFGIGPISYYAPIESRALLIVFYWVPILLLQLAFANQLFMFNSGPVKYIAVLKASGIFTILVVIMFFIDVITSNLITEMSSSDMKYSRNFLLIYLCQFSYLEEDWIVSLALISLLLGGSTLVLLMSLIRKGKSNAKHSEWPLLLARSCTLGMLSISAIAITLELFGFWHYVLVSSNGPRPWPVVIAIVCGWITWLVIICLNKNLRKNTYYARQLWYRTILASSITLMVIAVFVDIYLGYDTFWWATGTYSGFAISFYVLMMISGPLVAAAYFGGVSRDGECIHCGYLLYGINSERCPECGNLISTKESDDKNSAITKSL